MLVCIALLTGRFGVHFFCWWDEIAVIVTWCLYVHRWHFTHVFSYNPNNLRMDFMNLMIGMFNLLAAISLHRRASTTNCLSRACNLFLIWSCCRQHIEGKYIFRTDNWSPGLRMYAINWLLNVINEHNFVELKHRLHRLPLLNTQNSRSLSHKWQLQ